MELVLKKVSASCQLPVGNNAFPSCFLKNPLIKSKRFYSIDIKKYLNHP